MEPKEKAKELVDKFVSLDNDIFCSVNYPYSKKCALIAVDEIIQVTSVKDQSGNGCDLVSTYWQEIKNEINNL